MLGVVVGLAAEARMARSLGAVQTGGGTYSGGLAAAERAVAAGAEGLLSFGLCGGLDPWLRPGALVIPVRVLVPTPPGPLAGEGRQEGSRRSSFRYFATNPILTADLAGPTCDALIGSETIVVDAAAKSVLAATGAEAVDTESGAVAIVAARHGLPFAALRAVCDPASRTLPPAALIALDQRGAIGLGRLTKSILARPTQLPALLALARDAAAARSALLRRVRDLGRRGPSLMP